MADTSEELAEKMELLTKTFLTTIAKVGEQLKELHVAVYKNIDDVKEMKKEQKEQGIRVAEVEDRTVKGEKRMNSFEDRFRRANLRLRGFKGDFSNNRNMIDNIWEWMKGLGIEIDNFQIERAHWLPGVRRAGDQRDIIVKFASERLAEHIYKELKKITDLNCNGAPVRVLKDLSRETLQERAILNPIADSLFKAKVRFSWGFPAAIIVYQDGKMYRARSIDEGREMLGELGVEYSPRQQQRTEGKKTPTGSGAAQKKEGGAGAAAGEESYKDLFETFSSAITPLVEMSAVKALQEKAADDPSKSQRVTRQKKK